VKIKKLSEKAVIPSYGTDESAGLDFTATSEKVFVDGSIAYIEYGTDLAISIPKGFVGLIYPRSSISSNTSLILSNCVGVIDSDYTGEIKFRFRNLTIGAAKKYKIGDRIGQLVIMPYPKIEFEIVDDLDQTKRGEGGFGSTSK
jgi:dUTP pyrophosphatase